MLVSVIIPTYDRILTTLPIALDSVIKQKYRDLEIVIIADGVCQEIENKFSIYLSTIRENGIKIVFYNLPQHPNVPYKNAGAKARNIGLSLATGDFIAPLDDDDEYLPDHIQDAISCLNTHKADFYYCKAKIIEKNRSYIFSKALTDNCIPKCNGIIIHSSVVYRSNLKNIKYIETGGYGDAAMWNYMINELHVKVYFNDNIGIIKHGGLGGKAAIAKR